MHQPSLRIPLQAGETLMKLGVRNLAIIIVDHAGQGTSRKLRGDILDMKLSERRTLFCGPFDLWRERTRLVSPLR